MKTLQIIAFLLLAQLLQAQTAIGYEDAFTTAERFISQQEKHNALTLSEEIKSGQSGQTNLFVFAVEPKGFVIVSTLNEVLAYSFDAPLPEKESRPDSFAYWLELYNNRTDYLMAHPDLVKKPTKYAQEVEPLVTSVWGQGCFHNVMCPQDPLGPCGRVSAGCVAVAMAQIMYCNKQPTHGCGTLSYPSNYGTLTGYFGQTNYQWEQMVDTLHENNAAVARLISHCGISVQMKYGPHQSLSSTNYALTAFQQYFSYPTATLLQRTLATDEEWLNVIKSNLDRRLPLFYAGNSSLGGHAFVCDGYDSNGLFHFNFGWDGVADGYYTLDDPSGFSTAQVIIHDLMPTASIPIQSDSHGIIYVSPDGTGDGSSWTQATSDLQSAIYKSHPEGLTIWAKEGVYAGTSDKSYAYNLYGDSYLYGGFKGDEPYDYDLSQRDFEAHPTILDGNHAQGLFYTQFSVYPIVIDGFTLQNGNATHGGGILAKSLLHIKNCKFLSNYSKSVGGGLSLRPPSNPGIMVIIEDCVFSENEAKSYGGAVSDRGNTKYLRCQFHDNLSQKDGGAIYSNSYIDPSQFYCCTISNNTAQNGGGVATTGLGATFWSCLINNNLAITGGGCYLKTGAKLFNCTIVKNEAQTNYGGVYTSSMAPQEWIRNCIVWGNVCAGENTQIGPLGTYFNCAVEDEPSETNYNFKAESDNDGGLPRFYVRFQNANVAAGNSGQGGDWRLQSNSLCINKGVNIVNQYSTDLEGQPRCQQGNADFGAYETNTATHFIKANFCENSPYYYQDSLLAELGTYTFLYGGNPYDSLVVVQMSTPPPTIFLTEEICENEMYDFFGIMLNESGRYSTTINCITYELNLSIKPLDHVNMEEEICDGDSFDFFGTPLNEAGTYYDTVDCIAYKLGLDIKPSGYNHMEKTICEGETYDFFGRTLNQHGRYYKTIDCQQYELDLTVNPKPELRCSNDTLVEYGNPVYLHVSGADSYFWSTGETTESILIYPVTDKAYTVTGYLQNGCSNTASIMVKINNEADVIVLYPNPADHRTDIYKPLIDEVEVFDLLGVRMDRIDTNRQSVMLDVSHYTDGIYIVHIRCLNNHYFQKLVVRH